MASSDTLEELQPPPSTAETLDDLAPLPDEPAPSDTLVDAGASAPNGSRERDRHEAEALVGEVVDGRFALRRLIAIGGMGHVYEAKDRETRERVAVKTLKPHLAESYRVQQRFLREATALACTDSPHLVRIIRDGRLADGRPYYAMEYLLGRTLADLLEALERPMKPERAVLVAHQIAEALAVAHERGIVHRDLKPENVLVLEGPGGDLVKVLDFGLAKAADGSMDVTREGEVLGTPHYMSPEQVRGRDVDARADVYAFGVVFFEMLTGKMPFDGEGAIDIMIEHVEKPIPRLSDHVDVPVMLQWIVMSCLAKDREERFASAAELLEELDGAVRLYHRDR